MSYLRLRLTTNRVFRTRDDWKAYLFQLSQAGIPAHVLACLVKQETCTWSSPEDTAPVSTLYEFIKEH